MSVNMKEQEGPMSERTDPASGSEVVAHSSLSRPGRSVEMDIRPDAEIGRRRGPAPSAVGSPRSVDLHIEELVLNGFPPAHRYAIGDAVERELTRLFTEHGAPVAITDDLEIAHLNGGVINVKPGSNAETTGIQLARAIYGGLGK